MDICLAIAYGLREVIRPESGWYIDGVVNIPVYDGSPSRRTWAKAIVLSHYCDCKIFKNQEDKKFIIKCGTRACVPLLHVVVSNSVKIQVCGTMKRFLCPEYNLYREHNRVCPEIQLHSPGLESEVQRNAVIWMKWIRRQFPLGK